MQCLGCCFTVLYQRQTNVAGAGVAAVGLLPRQVTSRHHAHAAVPVEFDRRRFVAAMRRHVEPHAETAGRTMITITIAENLIGEIEFETVEPSVFLDMRLVAVGGDGDMLQWHRHLGRSDIAQLVIHCEKFPLPVAKPTRIPGRLERFESD